ncbi:DUF3732 domain-containing protein [Acinetobacter vivianii]|uniref:DUF3732 domain-containing protein n=1 Tax=Acinetobacter vivianii TaxID=1776742 RepID=UPI004042D846
MQFFLEKIILWPINKLNKIEVIDFYIDKINVIHGRSGTGKSSIIAIIDYCLGASRCSIPVGLIRDEVDWFGVAVSINNNKVLICRRTPRNKQVSREFFVKSFNENEPLPEDLISNFNDLKLKNLFNNRILKISDLPQTIDDENKGFDAKASYRDLAAFNFLPQHIVANPNTLFYKADAAEHKERLKKILPLALGIVDNDYLVNERIRAIKIRERDLLIKKQNTTRREISAWAGDVNNLWFKAVELGLVDGNHDYSLEDKIQEFESIVTRNEKNEILNSVNAPNYTYTNDIYYVLREKEQKIQRDIDNIVLKIRKVESLSGRAKEFSEAVSLENSRVVNFEWLKEKLSLENYCIACGANNNQLSDLIGNLDSKVRKINDLSGVLYENPIENLELENLKTNLIKKQNKLHDVRKYIASLNIDENNKQGSLNQIYILIGRIQSILINYKENKNEDELSFHIKKLDLEIQKLDLFFMNSGKVDLEIRTYRKIGDLIKAYADEFQLDSRGEIILDKTELTLRFDKKASGKKEFLWEVGSGENWMGYHISTFLALHEYFSQQEVSPVFNFLVIDQPSQVYFPTAVSGYNELDYISDNLNEGKFNRNHDLKATKRIFKMLELGAKRSNYTCQIIVLEHADQSIWGEFKNTKEVRNWKHIGDGLIPSHWIKTTN